MRLGNALGRRCCWSGWTRGSGRGGLPAHALDRQPVQPGAVNRLIAAVVDPLSGQPMFKQGRVQARAQPTRWQGLWCGRHDWREGVDWWARAPLPGATAPLLASWSESPERLWQRLGAEGHWLRLPLKEGWLAVAPGRGSHRGDPAGGERRPDIKVDLLASLLGTLPRRGP